MEAHVLIAVKDTYYKQTTILRAYANKSVAEEAKALIEQGDPRSTIEIVTVPWIYARDGTAEMLQPGFRYTPLIGDGEPELFRPASNAETATG